MFIPDLTTTWNVNIKSDDIDEAIETIQSSPILSVAGDEVLQRLTNAKSELEGLATPVSQAIAETQQSYQENYIEMNTSIDTGLMHDTITIEDEGEGIRSVGPTAYSLEGFPYPMAIENGSKSHWVAPKTASVLHWIQDGEHRFSKGHMVSGIKSRPFVEPSRSSTMAEVEAIIKEVLG